MNITPKNFQVKAIDDCVTKFGFLNDKSSQVNRRLLLTAGCGSGKTFMLASILNEVTPDDLTIVVTPGTGSLSEGVYRSLKRDIDAGRQVV